MRVKAKNHDDLVEFYIQEDAHEPNIFEIWERGGSRGDSVTPSTYSAEYRNWMCGLLITELERNGGGLLSLGCGNAAVEAEVARKGYRVLAVDAMEDAVKLAQQKGLDAICADIYQWEPDETWPVIYVDGVLGHLYHPQDGLIPIMERIRSWLAPRPDSRSGSASLIASNDATASGADVQKAPKVNGFYWLSGSYMQDQTLKAGFDEAHSTEFRYSRPLSGERIRAIIIGHVADPVRQ